MLLALLSWKTNKSIIQQTALFLSILYTGNCFFETVEGGGSLGN